MNILIASLILCSVTLAHPPAISTSNEKAENVSINGPVNLKNSDKLPVQIYYETLCPDSKKMLDDLGREYHTFKKYLSLEFIPFGRAQSSDSEGNEFVCHHGPNECAGNKIHSCGVKYLKNQDAQQQFVICHMNSDTDQSGKEV